MITIHVNGYDVGSKREKKGGRSLDGDEWSMAIDVSGVFPLLRLVNFGRTA